MSRIWEYIMGTRRWIKVTVILFLVFIIALSVGNFLTRRYIQSHCEEWIGRRVSIGSIRINPLNSSFIVRRLKLYERESDTVFLSIDRLYVNVSPLEYFFSWRATISRLVIGSPRIRIVMHNNAFNFGDLIARFASKEDSTTGKKPPSNDRIEFALEDFLLEKGAISFTHPTFGGSLGLDSIDFRCPRVASDQSNIDFTLHVAATTGGSFNVAGKIDRDSLSYALKISGHDFDIGFLSPFVDKVMYVSSVAGLLTADLNVGGKFGTSVSEAEGLVRLSGFQLLDTIGKPSVGLGSFELQIDSIDATKGTYAIAKVLLDGPYLRFDLAKSGNNLIRSISNDSDSTSMATNSLQSKRPAEGRVDDEYLRFFQLLNDYFINLGRAYAVNFYTVDSLVLRRGKVEFSDFTLDQQFHFLFEDLGVIAANVKSDNDSIMITMHSSLNKSGVLEGYALLKPKQIGDITMHYTLNELKVSDFSPYAEYYVAHPFWDGTVFLESTSEVKNHMLESDNLVVIKDLEVGDKMSRKTVLNLPLKLAVSLLKDVHGNVDLRIPLRGDVNDPKFRVMPVILKIMKDLIVKAVASPYKLLATTFNASEEDLKDIKYDYLQYELRSRQKKGLDLLARILNQKKDMTVKLLHLSNPEWEVRQYALFEAKKMYYMKIHKLDILTFDDSVAIDRIHRLDTAFDAYLSERVGNLPSNEIEKMALQLVGVEKTQQLLADVETRREKLAEEYLAAKVDDHSRFTIADAATGDATKFNDRPRFMVLFQASPSSSPPPNQ